MFSMKIYNKNQLDIKEWFLFPFFIYQIYLIAILNIYKVFKVAFLKYEIVDKIHSFKRFVL
jgi:hypothetical protein